MKNVLFVLTLLREYPPIESPHDTIWLNQFPGRISRLGAEWLLGEMISNLDNLGYSCQCWLRNPLSGIHMFIRATAWTRKIHSTDALDVEDIPCWSRPAGHDVNGFWMVSAWRIASGSRGLP